MDAAIVKDFARLRVLQKSASEHRRTSEQEVDEGIPAVSSILDDKKAFEDVETGAAVTPVVAAAPFPLPSGTPSRRRAWRRRCKSTSNLSAAAALGSGRGSGAAAALSGSSTSSDEAEGFPGCDPPPLGLSSRDPCGTSSLQLSDSDDDMGPPPVSTTRSREHTLRKKRVGSDQGCATSSATATGGFLRKSFPNESDSVTENAAPHPVRPNTKRKRRCKRMALDPTPSLPQGLAAVATTVAGSSTGKRHRARPRHDHGPSGSAVVMTSGSGRHHGSAAPPSSSASFGIVVGKRKRSNREKSVEPEHLMRSTPCGSSTVTPDAMDCDDDRRSSSSLSSTEWDEEEDSDNPTALNNSREADDEQSDWPGHEWGGGSNALTDDDGEDGLSSLFLSSDASEPLTATARQAYMARMKRLAECVPGREIRAGARK
jgi:hypothetical protein